MSISPACLRVRISSACASGAWSGYDFPFGCSEATFVQRSESLAENAFAVTTSTIFHEKCPGFSQYNSLNCEPLFVLGGSGMYILVPWKPVVLVWGLVSGMILVSFVASSLLQGRNPFAPGVTITRPLDAKAGTVHTGQQPKPSRKAAGTPSQ